MTNTQRLVRALHHALSGDILQESEADKRLLDDKTITDARAMRMHVVDIAVPGLVASFKARLTASELKAADRWRLA